MKNTNSKDLQRLSVNTLVRKPALNEQKPLKGLVAGLLGSAIVSGCASLPDATVKYYLAKSEVSFKVIRVVTCDKNNYVLIADAVTPTVSHSAEKFAVGDPKKDLAKSINLHSLKSVFSDSEIKVEMFEDGRLKGINASSTGQGEAILKTAISIAGAVLAFNGGAEAQPKVCAKIKPLAGDKGLVLTYQGIIDLNNTNEQIIKPEPVTKAIVEYNGFDKSIGYVCAKVLEKKPSAPRVAYTKKDKDAVIEVREPGQVQIEITASSNGGCQNDPLWKESLTVAQAGSDYVLPLPRPAVFGKRALGVTFAESGALTMVQFAANTGTGQALNVGSAILSATDGRTTAEKASAVKAEADLIAQQQRLLQCQVDPTNCK